MQHFPADDGSAADDSVVVLSATKPEVHPFFRKRAKKGTNATRLRALEFSAYAGFPSSMFYKHTDADRMRDDDYAASDFNSPPGLDFYYTASDMPRMVQAPAEPGVFKELPALPQSIEDLCFLREVARKIKSLIATSETKGRRRQTASSTLPDYIEEDIIQRSIAGVDGEEWGIEETGFVPNIFVVCGPHGTGKTSMARLLSKELHRRLIYIDCLTSENGNLFGQLLEASAFCLDAGDRDAKHPGQLVLIDDIEVVLEEDTFFWSAASRFLQETRQSVIVTCSTRCA